MDVIENFNLRSELFEKGDRIGATIKDKHGNNLLQYVLAVSLLCEKLCIRSDLSRDAKKNMVLDFLTKDSPLGARKEELSSMYDNLIVCLESKYSSLKKSSFLERLKSVFLKRF